MRIKPFALERYFARYEFSTRYLLSSSDCDGWELSDILALADGEIRELWNKLRLGYTESQGLPLLRREIARLYKGIVEDEILLAVPEEAIFIAMNCLLEKGDRVLCTYPGYQSLYQIAESIGCTVDHWEPDEKAGWRFDPESLARKIRPATKMLVVNFPHNPTGSLPSVEEFRRIVEIAERRGVRVFSDEMYRFLEADPRHRLPSACEISKSAIALFGMSKTFGMAGIRLGWLATKDRALIQRMLEFKDYTTICAPGPSEILALIALRAKDKIIAKHLARIKRNLDLLDGFFARHSDRFSWVRPKAGTVGFPGYLDGNVDRFCKSVVEKAEIMLLPSSVYDYPKPNFRVGFGRENMPEALDRLEEHLNR